MWHESMPVATAAKQQHPIGTETRLSAVCNSGQVSLVQPGAAWCSLVQPGAAWCSLVQPGAAWCSLVQPGAAWCSLACHT
jgi:hypothetical protein